MIAIHTRKVVAAALALAILAWGGTALAVTVPTLPAPDPFNSAVRGAFTVYSFPILEDLGQIPKGSIPMSAVGLIKDDLVVYTGSAGDPVNNNNAPKLCGATNVCVNDAFPVVKGTDTSFGTNTATDPGPATFTAALGNATGTWDIRLDVLRPFIGNNDMIFLFNHNEEKSLSGLSEDLFGWGQVRLEDLGGAPDVCFNFNNNNTTTQTATDCTPPLPFTGRDLINPETPAPSGPQGDFVFAAGRVCLDGAGNNVPCGDVSKVLGPFDHNLGADRFAYALVSFGLNSFLSSCFADLAMCGYDVMRVDLRLAELSNGFEQLVIATATIEGPLPPSLLLLGAAGLGATLWRRVRRR